MSEQEMTIDERYQALRLKRLERMEREAERDNWVDRHPYIPTVVAVIIILGVMLFMKHFIIEA